MVETIEMMTQDMNEYDESNLERSKFLQIFADPMTREEREMLKKEKSRSVKIAYIKLRCIVVFAVTLIAILQSVYIITLTVSQNDNLLEKIGRVLESTPCHYNWTGLDSSELQP